MDDDGQRYFAEVELKERERIETDPAYRARYEMDRAIDKLERNWKRCVQFFTR